MLSIWNAWFVRDVGKTTELTVLTTLPFSGWPLSLLLLSSKASR